MRRQLLIAAIAVEGALLVGAALLLALAPQAIERPRPTAPVFEPPLHRAVTGDEVLYQIREIATGRVTGYIRYAVLAAVEYQGTSLGREFHLEISELDERGHTKRSRIMLLRPRTPTHGFLPPLFDEEEMPPGDRPLISALQPARVVYRKRELPGFLVEAVRPRWSLTQVKDRFWLCDAVPVFGVARRESDGLEWTVHTAGRRVP
ncbi:MAG: hypothetical protein ACREID_02710 [Planctomycetota bacterium]